MPFKRPKLAAPSSGRHEDQSLQEQVLKLMQKSQNMEQKVHALEQENNKLSLSVQTLQHQDELKQRAILQCEEHIRRLELQLTNVFQQHINQMQQMNQPLPFGRESSLSAVNPSSLMRYLSFNGSQGLGSSFSQELTRDLSRGISRITTPPRVGAGPGLSRLTTPPRTQLGAAAAAESLVANEMATAANGYGGEPTLGRDNRFKQFLAPGTSEGGAGGNSGPSLPRHPGMKRFGESSDGGSGNASGGATGGGATLPRHPGIKHFSGGPAPAGSFPNGIPTGFNNNLAGNSGNNGNNSNGQNQNGNGNTNNNGGTDSFANAVTREESFGISSLLDLSRGSSLPV